MRRPRERAVVIESFHFLRPEWLFALPIAALAWWLVRRREARGMRVILDYSWNHTGVTFWAWRDVLENQAESRFAGWY